jgi:hypothetical protein
MIMSIQRLVEKLLWRPDIGYDGTANMPFHKKLDAA